MTAQGQAELLLEESINHYAGAIEQISARVDGWRGTLQMTPKLENMLATAMDSNDLRVRAAALELYLAANNIAKAPTSVYTLEERVSQEPGARAWSLWMLGALGNRGVEPERVLREELNFIQDPSEETRFWAVEGLAHLGADAAIDPLLDVLRSDPSPKVRERAACSLAQSGMFTREQRMSAVPKLLDLADDVALEPTTRTWVYQALRDITGAGLGPDPQAWRNWWNEHGH
jgi:HEAT repeat protein